MRHHDRSSGDDALRISYARARGSSRHVADHDRGDTSCGFGADTVERDELLRATGLSTGGELTYQMLIDAQDRVEELFARRGFPSAKSRISIRTTDSPLDVIVIVGVEPGGARIIKRRFANVFETDEDKVTTLTDGYRVGAGDRADEEALDAADVALASRFRAAGFHRAVVSHDLVAAPTSYRRIGARRRRR